MLFSSTDFIIFFVIFLTLLALIKYKKFQYGLLLFASYFFFYYTSNYLISLLIFSTILDFYIGKSIFSSKNLKSKKILLIISLVGNLGLLGFYKYADFAILQFNFLGEVFDISESIPFLNLALPIGISFYTFQTISYTVDVYRNKITPAKSFSEFALFVSFFPQLVAGPIVRARDFLPQLREKFSNSEAFSNLKKFHIDGNNLKFGITMMAFGFFKKMFFADNIGPLVDDIFGNIVGAESFTIILGTIAFGIQIYCDFSGYSDIAIGAALILGFKLPENFNKPYFAFSPSDFWRRWHISLSSWLRDYLYIPLGGNKKSSSRTYFNLIIVMFLGGLWHGASWNFVIWGLLHGVYLSLHRVTVKNFPFLSNSYFFKSKTGKIFSILITQYLIFLAWIPFRVNDFNEILYAMKKYILLDFQIIETINVINSHKISFSLIFLFIILHYVSFKKKNIIEIIFRTKIYFWILFLIAIILSILLTYDGNPENFIYFKF